MSASMATVARSRSSLVALAARARGLAREQTSRLVFAVQQVLAPAAAAEPRSGSVTLDLLASACAKVETQVKAEDKGKQRQGASTFERVGEFAQLGLVRDLVTPRADVRLGSGVRPCLSLGGLSPIAFTILYGDQVDQVLAAARSGTDELVRRLVDENEYLEDTHQYMTAFIERQKETIANLERRVAGVRHQELD